MTFSIREHRRPALLAAVLAVVVLGACVAGGPVVQVTAVNGGGIDGLGEAEQARLAEIRQEAGTGRTESALASVIARTPSYSVAEYLALNPGALNPHNQDYRVGGYDVLNVAVYEEPDLSRSNIRVSAEGWISLPLIGRLPVADMTPSAIARRVREELAAQQYLLDAHVSVEVVEYNSRHFMVLGAVKTPGSYPLKAKERVLDAIAGAGGVDLEDSGPQAMIIRAQDPADPGAGKVVIRFDVSSLLDGGDQNANLLLATNDLVYIPSSDFYYIIGQVANPGRYPYPARDVTIVEAISSAGGFTPLAARNHTRIVRKQAGQEVVIQVRVDAITDSGLKGQDIGVLPGDVIVVPESLF